MVGYLDVVPLYQQTLTYYWLECRIVLAYFEAVGFDGAEMSKEKDERYALHKCGNETAELFHLAAECNIIAMDKSV